MIALLASAVGFDGGAGVSTIGDGVAGGRGGLPSMMSLI